MKARERMRPGSLAGALSLCWLLQPLLPAGAGAGGLRAPSLTDRGTRSSSISGASSRANASATQRLADFVERRRFEARVLLLDVSRDAERRAAERDLRSRGTRAGLVDYTRRIRQQDDLDDLRLRIEALRHPTSRQPADPGRWWRDLGPVTRRIFLRSGLDLRKTRRGAERDARLRELQREIEGPTSALRDLLNPAQGPARDLRLERP